jgi:predicted 3-demethylubiquinone-9 3-methyltransferase (glyoxalase superfamily)
MPDISPFLWFDHQAEEAANFYVSVFPGSRITEISRYGEAGPGAVGTAMVVAFELRDQSFQALNGGPHYSFTPAISFVVPCDHQTELDAIWDKLCDGGSAHACGWVTDRFGVTWQIIPRILSELLGDDDRDKANRVMEAMLKMVKLDFAQLRQAYAGEREMIAVIEDGR